MWTLMVQSWAPKLLDGAEAGRYATGLQLVLQALKSLEEHVPRDLLFPK